MTLRSENFNPTQYSNFQLAVSFPVHMLHTAVRVHDVHGAYNCCGLVRQVSRFMLVSCHVSVSACGTCNISYSTETRTELVHISSMPGFKAEQSNKTR